MYDALDTFEHNPRRFINTEKDSLKCSCGSDSYAMVIVAVSERSSKDELMKRQGDKQDEQVAWEG